MRNALASSLFLLAACFSASHVAGQSIDGTSELPSSLADFDTFGSRPPFEEASHECWGSSYEHRVCKFNNLVLWNDTFYYATSEESVLQTGLPDIALSWVRLPFYERMRFSQNPPHANGGQVVLLQPEKLPFEWWQAAVLEVQDAVLWHLTYHDNFGHLLGEHGPTLHNVLCTFYGRCEYSDMDRDVHILLPHNEDEMLAVLPQAANEMFSCFTLHPMRQTDDFMFQGRAVHVRSLLVGVGASCRGFPWCRSNFGRSRVADDKVVSWRRRFLTCMGQPADAHVASLPTNVLLINRPTGVGRAFLNINDVLEALKDTFRTIPVAVRELDGRSLAQQAALYVNATVVIQMHGAALGHMVFLPAGATLVDIVPQNHEDKHAWAFYMAADYRALRYNPVAMPPQRSIVMLHKVKQFAEWHRLSPEWRQRILTEGVCPQDDQVDFQYNNFVICRFYWFLKNSNVIIDIDELLDAVQLALRYVARARLPLQGYGLSSRFSVFV